MPLCELAEFGLMPAGQGIGEHEGVALAGFSKQVINFTHHATHVLTFAHKLPDGSSLSVHDGRLLMRLGAFIEARNANCTAWLCKLLNGVF